MTSGLVVDLQVVWVVIDAKAPWDSCSEDRKGQQENKGRYDQGQHEYSRRQYQSVEHRGRQDRGYDSKRQDFRGQDQRFAGRNGNDRQGQGNYNQRQHRGQSTRDFNQGHASGSAGQRRLLGVFYFEGPTQHKVKDCPQGKQKQSMPTDFARLPPTTGWVYATTRDQAAKTSGTITGILYIDDRTVFVLFDTGATHSIISTTFAKKLNMTPTPLIERVIISTPMKNHMLIDHEYVNCPLRFDDRSERSVYRECLENGFIRPSVSPLGCIDLICLEVREEHALNGIIMDPSKMKLHQNGGRDLLWWTDCESFFWGLLAINRRYVEGDFGGIERRLVSDPILTLPSGLVVFQDIYSDASKKCLDVELCDDVLVAIGASVDDDGVVCFEDSYAFLMIRHFRETLNTRIHFHRIRRIQFSVQYSVFTQQIDTTYPPPLDTVYRSSGTETEIFCMTKSSTNELFTPYKEPEREFRSSRKHFKTLSLDELRSPDFNLLSDQEYSKEEKAEAMAKTMEQYMIKTRTDYGSGVARPKIDNKDQFELKG
ncbi:reverse transcriptase domain-containing protein [Tanacetum coccineum]